MARPLTLTQARKAAWRGQPDVAIPALEAFAASGDHAASASLAELLAFSGRWSEVIVQAGRLVENPGAVYAGNVFIDMIGLLGRAGHETAQWNQVYQAAEAAWDKIDQIEERAHLRHQHLTILGGLKNYALRSGQAPHELIRVFGVKFGFTQADGDTAYEKAVHEAAHNNKDLHDNPAKLKVYLFGIAIGSNQTNDAVRMYEAGDMPANFDCAVKVAQIFVGRAEMERAWQVLWDHMSLWWPVDKAQVAPVVLLTDGALFPLLSRERCEQVLALPRGPEAQKAAVKS